MANKIYKDEIGLAIILNCGQDVSGATGVKIKAKKPDKTEVEWDAEVYDTKYIKYLTEDGDLDLPGTYYLQAYMTLGDWTGPGNTVALTVLNDFSTD
jgi:hypothetical protein